MTNQSVEKIGLGGSCHWCTEAIFLSLKGVERVEQGWIAATDDDFSEAVIVHFDPELIDLQTLIAVHLHSHSSTSAHSMRGKYRSAVYVFNDAQQKISRAALDDLQKDFDKKIITQVIPFQSFKGNQEKYLNYYYQNPDKPFCQTFISPKLKEIMLRFSGRVNTEKVKHLR